MAARPGGKRAEYLEGQRLTEGDIPYALLLSFLAFFFVIVWVVAFVTFHVAHFFVHVFLILALIFFVVHLLRPRRT
jgi:Flp pilus assembly protein TadB